VSKVSDLAIALVSTATFFGDSTSDYGLPPRFALRRADPSSDPVDRAHELRGAFAVVAGPETYGEELLEHLPDLCLIARSGVGYDQIDTDAASRLGIHVTTTPGANAQGVAEHAISLLLNLVHRIPHYDRRVRDLQWRDGEFFPEVQGMSVGIIGMGRIGTALAGILHALDAKVLAYDSAPITGAPDYVTVCRTLDDLLPQCQAISLHVPLLDSTRNLIGRKELATLPRGSYVINTARGGTVDEAALADALESGHIAGAALDVLATEPPTVDNRLLSLDTCVFSPHTASFGHRTIERMTAMIAGQLKDVADGRAPEGLVNDPLQARFPIRVG
jgi:D-3-phosphoglycerate dehydrogenase